MKCIMQVWSPEAVAGQYLVSFDFDAFQGKGFGLFTYKPEEAMRFKSLEDAMTFWKTTSTVKPKRPDGKPNRPLTASTISVFKIEEQDDGTTSEDDAARRHHGSGHH